ncbi:restriction endonuclease subunit S, partial [Lutibacter sp. B1]|uniref:restriction endonuclease subunit S n=1 Tax=Lutibacter sp. B1 TaxID=2725996 RepID=UPI00181E1EEC
NLQVQLTNLSHKIFTQEIRFKSENGSNFPEWKEKELKYFCSFYSGGTPKSTNKSYYLGDIPFIGSGNISDDSVDSFITDEALKSSSAKLVNKGDLLYALYGATSGEVAISKIRGAINQAVLCIKTTQNKEYLFYLLKNSKNRIVQTFIQGGQGNLSAKIVKELKFNFPCLEEQIKIASFLSLIDEKLMNEMTVLKNLTDQKKYLLQQLFI